MLKTGLVLMAALGLGAVGASGASATLVLTPGVKPAVITSEQIPHQVEGKETNYFEITGKKSRVQCKKVIGVGTTEELEVIAGVGHTVFSECSATGGFAATVDVKGCDLLATGETNAEGAPIGHVICETGKAIEVTIPSINCTLVFHEQTPTSGGGFSYINKETNNPDDVEGTMTMKGITYEVKNPEERVLCTAALGKNKAEGNDADLIESATLRAYEDKGTSGTGTLTNEGLTFNEGAQVKLTVDSKP
jgi:hypothetical protein